jgi:probable DNA repair protein
MHATRFVAMERTIAHRRRIVVFFAMSTALRLLHRSHTGTGKQGKTWLLFHFLRVIPDNAGIACQQPSGKTIIDAYSTFTFAPGTIVLCATNRLAQALRAAAPAVQRDREQAVWDTPSALALDAWLDQLGEEAMLAGVLPAQVLLDAAAEHLLWERIVARSVDAGAAPLFDAAAMARKAAEAHALYLAWDLGAPGGPTREAEAFRAWSIEFAAALRQHGWTTAALRRHAVVEALEDGRLRPRVRAVLAGFDTLTPLQQRLRAALDAGFAAGFAAVPDMPQPQLAAYRDVAAECRAAARWAAGLLAAQPGARIGIVAPDLGRVRARLEQELDAALHPDLAGPAQAEQPRRYNFSLGRPLADAPLVACALHLLHLARSPQHVEQAELALLLHHPCWSDSLHEADARGLLDARMRRRLPHRTGLAAVLGLARGMAARADGGACAPALALHLAGLARHGAAAAPLRLPPSAWARRIRTLLGEAGWAGGADGCRPLSSHEYQARQAWSALLDGFACADEVAGDLGFGQAVARLEALCRQRVFQPQTRGTPQVEVLGMLESTGLAFDALWIMGLHDGDWPPAPAPNPLVPAALQRDRGVANACATVQLAHARAIGRRLLGQAPHVRLSCALADGAQELRPSPLFAASAPVDAWADAAAAPLALESLDDARGPALGAHEQARGGTALLRAQAICPAWAFYRYRLGAAALEQPQDGLAASERGTLVHDALEAFWGDVPGRQALAALAAQPAAWRARIAAAAEASLQAHAGRAGPLAAQARALEGARLAELLQEWLERELERADFTVLECEREVRSTVGRIALTLRIDRIDLQDDGAVVIDYKTGSPVDTRNWAAARITEPQLPLYALALSGSDPGHAVAALAFARVRPGETRFAGLSAQGGSVKGVTGMHQARERRFAAFADWNALQDHWRARIGAMAREFADGAAGVAFADAGQLAHCEVLPLLRVPERETLRLRAAATAAAGPADRKNDDAH